MKKLMIMLLCCLLLTACAAPDTGDSTTASTDPQVPSTTQSTLPSETQNEQDATEGSTEPEMIRFTVYAPNENLDGFIATEVQGENLTVLEALRDAGVVTGDVAVNSVTQDGSALTVDLNSAFRDQLLTQGSTGERFLMGSVVNTFLSAYDAETVLITVDGEILESGHVIYDFPMEFFE